MPSVRVNAIDIGCTSRYSASLNVTINSGYDINDYTFTNISMGYNDTGTDSFWYGDVSDAWIVQAWAVGPHGHQNGAMMVMEFTMTHIPSGQQKAVRFNANASGDQLSPGPF